MTRRHGPNRFERMTNEELDAHVMEQLWTDHPINPTEAGFVHFWDPELPVLMHHALSPKTIIGVLLKPSKGGTRGIWKEKMPGQKWKLQRI